MKKVKTKQSKEPGAVGSRSKVVKMKPGRARTSWVGQLPRLKAYVEKIKQFLGEVVTELKLVTWPNRKETLGATGVVLFLVIIIAVYLGLVDYALSHLVRALVR